MIKILHVSSGNPKFHPGGANKYCFDLFEVQKQMKHDVQIIFAGKLSKKYKIVKINKDFLRFDGALPVSNIFGIDKPARYMRSYDKTFFIKFFTRNKYDVLHVHSLQGFPFEFFEAAKECNLRLIFTTHDYYPFCFKYNLFDYDGNICNCYKVNKCALCSKKDALKENIQKIKQNPIADFKIFKLLKKFALNKKIKKHVTLSVDEQMIEKEELFQFDLLRNYYIKILKLFDVIHCNSNLTKNIYKKFCYDLNYMVVPITHSSLIHFNNYNHKKDRNLHIGYYGGPGASKGFNILTKALDIVESRTDINIFTDFYGGGYINTNSTLRNYHERLDGKKLSNSFLHLDIIIVPSQWYETFGFLTIEALAKKIPVIVSDVVGSKDLVFKINPKAIFNHKSEQELAEKIIYFSSNDNYIDYVNKIELSKNILDIKFHVKDMIKKVYGF